MEICKLKLNEKFQFVWEANDSTGALIWISEPSEVVVVNDFGDFILIDTRNIIRNQAGCKRK